MEMGADIHLYVERKSTRVRREEFLNEIFEADIPVQKEWESADKWKKNKYYDPNKPNGEIEYEVDYDDLFYRGRNYYLFAVLADVRNGWDIKPIDEPRGIPTDLSERVQTIIDAWKGDGHSHSYFTLKELLDVDWEKYHYIEEEEDGPPYIINKKKVNYLSDFMETIDKLKKLDSDPNNIRIVFFFDN